MQKYVIVPQDWVTEEINNMVDAESKEEALEIFKLKHPDVETIMRAVDEDERKAENFELAGCILDMFEDWMEKKGIKPETIHELNEDNEEAILYGEDYSELEDGILSALGRREE